MGGRFAVPSALITEPASVNATPQSAALSHARVVFDARIASAPAPTRNRPLSRPVARLRSHTVARFDQHDEWRAPAAATACIESARDPRCRIRSGRRPSRRGTSGRMPRRATRVCRAVVTPFDGLQRDDLARLLAVRRSVPLPAPRSRDRRPVAHPSGCARTMPAIRPSPSRTYTSRRCRFTSDSMKLTPSLKCWRSASTPSVALSIRWCASSCTPRAWP